MSIQIILHIPMMSILLMTEHAQLSSDCVDGQLQTDLDVKYKKYCTVHKITFLQKRKKCNAKISI